MEAGRRDISLRIGRRNPAGRTERLAVADRSAGALVGDVSRDVLRPAFCGIEADDADRVLVLAGEQIPNDGFQIGRFVIGFRPDAAITP